MSSPSDDQRFLDLLQRWQSGDFTRQDEQALRSLTESDDFRREAMEGFQSAPEENHDERLTALRERLQTAGPQARVLPFAQVLAVAAALLVLIAAFLFFPRGFKDEAAPIAQTAVPAPSMADSTPQIQSADQPGSGAIAQVLPQTRTSESSNTPAADKELSYSATSAADDQVAAFKMNDKAAKPVEPATESVSPPAPSIRSGAPGGEVMSVAKAKTMPAKAARSTTADTTALAWNETEKKSDLDKLRREVRAEKESPAQSEPVEGWDAFNEYLRQSARLPFEARDHNVSGAVRLRFTVNVNGDPQNFIVLHSLGYGCDEEAKRLIQNWSWVRGKQPDVTVEVKFVR